MTLSKHIQINTHYTRSINLERDAANRAVVDAYIPTSRALRTLERVIASFGDHQAPRAWSLIGPYGSGKSSFSVFLAQLLADPGGAATKAAQQVLSKADAQIAQQMKAAMRGSNGYCAVLLTGSPEPLAKRIVRALHRSAKAALAGPGKPFKVLAALEQALLSETITTSELLEWVEQLQGALHSRGYRGLVIVIDELGKFLEYEARHHGANDIFLLQALAEHACKEHKANLLLIVMLHQAMEQYAKGLGESLKKEWSKVQGRFEEVPFLESSEQVLRVVSAAFTLKLPPADRRQVEGVVKQQVKVLQENGALPASLTTREAQALFLSCYPLHPVTAMILPLLCQKIAQNERTLFSYLGSHESHGFADQLAHLNVGDFIEPEHVYDYFITNQPAVIGDHFTHRRWVEVLTALERLGDVEPAARRLLKTIGLLNIVGARGGLKASKAVLRTCLGSAFSKAESSLLAASVVTYRKFGGEYRVWQGSDFDLEEAIAEEQGKVGNFSLATILTERKPMLPIVARRHTIESGTLRYFEPRFVDAKTYGLFDPAGSDPALVFFLAEGKDDEDLFRRSLKSTFSAHSVVALCLNGAQLRDAAAEVLALRHVQVARHELNTDPIAKREFLDRLTAAESAESALLQNLLDYPEDAQWYWNNERLKVGNKRQFQVVLSQVLQAIYCDAPRLHNELINRDRPSSQANAARNKLLMAMLQKAGERDLGIEKFPPEKAIYRSLLLDTGIHCLADESVDRWQFSPPSPKDAGLVKVWDVIDCFLDGTEKEPKAFVSLNAVLMAPPFGLKAGVLPILYMAVYAVYQHELALYENRIYRPFFTDEMLDRFVKRPDEFTVQRFRISGVRASLFKEYSRALHNDDQQRTLLDLARALATEMGRLPEYAQRTELGLSKASRDVRSAFNLAKSPRHLLFHDLPLALGYDSRALAESETQLAEFAGQFTAVLCELRNAHGALIDRLRRQLSQAFNLSAEISLGELRAIVAENCSGLENYTVDGEHLRPLIMRLIKTTGTDDEWLENVLAFLGGKPSKKWLDADERAAEYRLMTLSRTINDLDKLRIHESKRDQKRGDDFDVYLLRSVKKGGALKDEVVSVDPASRQHLASAKKQIYSVINSLHDKELGLALLAEVVDEFLGDYHRAEADMGEGASAVLRKGAKGGTA